MPRPEDNVKELMAILSANGKVSKDHMALAVAEEKPTFAEMERLAFLQIEGKIPDMESLIDYLGSEKKAYYIMQNPQYYSMLYALKLGQKRLYYSTKGLDRLEAIAEQDAELPTALSALKELRSHFSEIAPKKEGGKGTTVNLFFENLLKEATENKGKIIDITVDRSEGLD